MRKKDVFYECLGTDPPDETLPPPVKTSGEQAREFNGNKTKETQAFKNLPHAIHNECCKLEDTNQLCLMTKLADYYLALPALSKSLNRLLTASDIDIASNALQLIEVAVKLRHAPIFKYCVIYLAGWWNTDVTSKRADKLDIRSREVALKARNKTLQAIAKAQQSNINLQRKAYAIRCITDKLPIHHDSLLPGYFHHFSDTSYWPLRNDKDIQPLYEAVAPLVEDNLFFKKRYKPGDDLY
jgi:hypothetical protein